MTIKKTPTRKALSKKIRFEIFKRDSFKCQYCGAEAPNVLLHVDHIKPVAKGGDNNITNLITSCIDCNLGKSYRELGDTAVINKSRQQMEELQERREQLEMIMQWREGLKDLKNETVLRLAKYWEDLSGFFLNENGKNKLKGLIKKYSIEEITKAMDISAEKYLIFNKDNFATHESGENAFHKIGGICSLQKASEENPDIKEVYYIRGILRNRLDYFDPVSAIQWLKAARSWGVTIRELKDMACSVKNWTAFSRAIDEIIEKHRSEEEEQVTILPDDLPF